MADNIPLKKEEVFSVKIFFVNPIELLDVIMNTLLQIEFETYYIEDSHKDVLLKILPKFKRNILFFCVRNALEVNKWIEYVAEIKKIKSTHILIGGFYYDQMNPVNINKFLEESVPMISFSDIKNNTIQVMKKILASFEAKGTRKYIRSEAYGISKVHFFKEDLKEPIIGKVMDISSHAFTCRVLEKHEHLIVGHYFKDILLILKGARLNVSAKVLGFSKKDPSIFILKICKKEIIKGKVNYNIKIPNDIKNKLHRYIKECLKENMLGLILEQMKKDEKQEKKELKERTEKEKKLKEEKNKVVNDDKKS